MQVAAPREGLDAYSVLSIRALTDLQLSWQLQLPHDFGPRPPALGDGDLQVHTSPSSDKAGYPYHLSNDCEHDRLHGSSIILVLWRAVA